MIGIIDFQINEFYPYIPTQYVSVACLSYVIVKEYAFYRLAITKDLIKTEEGIASTELGEVIVDRRGKKPKFSINVDIYDKAVNIEKITISCNISSIRLNGHGMWENS